ncbi:MAG: SPFH domain-containing protein [Verrucomicrobiota bacterium]|nr:SPFH domain-containing protein [Verrucomicrobiota bacterium]
MSDNMENWERRRSPPPLLLGNVRLPGALTGAAGLFLLVVALALAGTIWWWYWWRIELDADQIAVLIHKTGEDLPSGQILATSPHQKGIQAAVLSEGRYFRNPYSWGWRVEKIIDIPAGKLGVQIRLFGDDLPKGEILAAEKSKGILKDVLRPGKHRVNPYAYQVDKFDAIAIKPGCIGVVTALTGLDILQNDMPPGQRNTFLVGEGMKGVQAVVLDPGTYYLNPYMFNVAEVTLQSQRFEMSGEDAVIFLTLDGFTITVEGTIEYALAREKAAILTHEVGEMDDILKKIILPRARAFSRSEGSKNPAKNFITGTTRQQFQNNLEAHLQNLCKGWGIEIKSVLIRNITPPDQIASIIREREVAVQTAKKFEQQIEQAKSKAELTRQEMLAVQNKEKVQADTIRIRAVIKARQDQAVAVTAANQGLQVAKLENQASVAQAEAILAKAGADQQVIRMKNEAEASVIANQVKAFGNGVNFGRYVFYERLAPRIQTILSGDDEDGLGGIFKCYVPSAKEVKR